MYKAASALVKVKMKSDSSLSPLIKFSKIKFEQHQHHQRKQPVWQPKSQAAVIIVMGEARNKIYGTKMRHWLSTC